MITGTITFTVYNPQKLWDSASAEYVGARAAGSPDSVGQVLGTRDNPNIDACLKELYWSNHDQAPGMTLWDLTEVI